MKSILAIAGTELRLATRSLAQRPGYTGVSAFTLALGIGSSVAIFSVLNAVVLRPLPYPDADRIVEVFHHVPGLNLPDVRSSPGLVARYQQASRTLVHIGAYEGRQLNLTGVGSAERVRAVAMTPEILAALATRPAVGRGFTASDARRNVPLVTILTDSFWRSRFAGDAAVVGRTLQLDGRAAEIVGVMPPGFAFPDPETRLFVPLAIEPETFGSFGVTSIARLAPGASVEAARREIQQLQSRLDEWFPDLTPVTRSGWSSSVQPWKERVIAGVSTTLWVLFATVGLVLLVAAANVANLLLVRAESRQREVAVKAALGASRARLAAAFVAESFVLAVIGGAAGLLLAEVGTRLLILFGPPRLPRLQEVRVDRAAFVFTVGISVLAAAVLGMLPTLNLGRRSLSTPLNDGARGSTSSRGRQRVRQLLIVTQVAMALVLLVGAGLMFQSVMRLNAVDPGFRVDGLLTTTLSVGARPDRAQVIELYRRMLEEMARVPGVSSVGAAGVLPVAATGMSGASFEIRSRPTSGREPPLISMYTPITAGYFETLGAPLLAGRAPEAEDLERSRPVAWVNRAFARQYLGGRALGESIRIYDPWLEIVGVVGDLRTSGLREDPRPMVYLPLSHPAVKLDVLHAVARTPIDPMSIAPSVRAVVEGVDASVPLTMRAMEEVVAASLAPTMFTVTLLWIAALTGLVLGLVGLYGAISYIAAQRTSEIAVRLALGAKPRRVLAMVLRQGATVTIVGIVVGLGAAWASARVLSSMLFEVSAQDPLTYGVVATLLLLVSLGATYLPARRAAAINPIQALRNAG